MGNGEARTDTTVPANEKPRADTKKLYRLPKSGKIAGVCAGLADYLDMDVTLIRVIFVVLTLASGGFGLLLYLILAIITPADDTHTIAMGQNAGIRNNINGLTEEIRHDGTAGRIKSLLGLGLVLFGLWLLLVQFFPQWAALNWNLVWPALLVLLGVMFIAGSRR